jgi:hypothetical protein
MRRAWYRELVLQGEEWSSKLLKGGELVDFDLYAA